MSSNALEVHVMGDKIEFLVNGKVVNTTRSPAKHRRPTALMAFASIICLKCRLTDFAPQTQKSSLSVDVNDIEINLRSCDGQSILGLFYRSISNPAALAEYAKLAGPAIQNGGGSFSSTRNACKNV